jgi:hypothetical protein
MPPKNGYLRREALNSTSRLALHRAWAALNAAAVTAVSQETLGELTRAPALGMPEPGETPAKQGGCKAPRPG